MLRYNFEIDYITTSQYWCKWIQANNLFSLALSELVLFLLK